MRRSKRLQDVVPRTDAKRLEVRLHAGVAGHHHDQRVLVGGKDGAENFHSRHFRHVEIEHHKVEVATRDQLESGAAASDGGYIVAFDLEKSRATFAEAAIIVHDEHSDARFRDREESSRGVRDSQCDSDFSCSFLVISRQWFATSAGLVFYKSIMPQIHEALTTSHSGSTSVSPTSFHAEKSSIGAQSQQRRTANDR